MPVEMSIWTPLIYQYAVGGVVFVFGLVLVLRARACDPRRAADRFWLIVVLAGMGAYFGVHLLVYLLAVHVLPRTPTAAGAG